MDWYIDKFTEFFKQWKKGYLYTRGDKSYYGLVKKLEVEDEFELSRIIFTPQETKDKRTRDIAVALEEVVYFRAVDGPLFNIGKYLSIIKLQQTRAIDAETENGERDLVCVAFGLEFYASPETAQVFKSDIKDLIASRLQNLPLVVVKEEASKPLPPVKLTPFFTSLIKKVGRLFKRPKNDASLDVSR